MAKPASGMYKTKARNLTEAQLKRAKGAKAATKRTVSISDTSRATTGANKGYTLGPGGKRLTGTVVMANGDRAVYKGGKRVTNVPKSSMKTKSERSTISRSSAETKPKRTITRVSPADRQEGSGSRKGMPAAQANRMGAEASRRNPAKKGSVKYVGETKYLSQSRMEKMLAKNRKNNVRYGK
jgi:hypothetical protein